MHAAGKRIMQMSPVRGSSVELQNSITVLMTSRVALLFSRTHCLVGSSMGVAPTSKDTLKHYFELILVRTRTGI